MNQINFLFTGFADAANGAATFFRSLIENRALFEDNGNTCKFYCQNLKNVLMVERQPKPSVSSTLHLKIRSVLYTSSKYSYLLTLFVVNLLLLRHARRVVSQIKSINDSDIWFSNDIFVAYYFLKKFPEAKKISLVLHNDGDPTKMLFGDYPKLSKGVFKNNIESKVLSILKKSDNIIFLSDNSLERFNRKYSEVKLIANRCVISNGVELPWVENNRSSGANSGKIVGISIGSINRRKGFDMLISAAEQMKKDNLQIEINCLGDLSDLSLVHRAKAFDNIRFLGAKDRREVALALSNADFFILCSRDEGMPISIIEAMQYKLPIFATNVGAINQMFTDGREGVLINPTRESIYNVLSDIDNKKYNLKEMGKLSYEKYNKDYTVAKMILKYIKILKI